MPRKPRRDRIKVLFDEAGADPETAWCEPLAAPNRYRLDNILFAHETPVYGDVIEAVAGDEHPRFVRVVERGGRYAMIIDYPRAEQFAPLVAFLKQQFEIESEGYQSPRGGRLGRLHLAVPDRHDAAAVFTAARTHSDGIFAIHPEIGPRPPAPPQVARPVANPLFQAIRANEVAAFDRLRADDLGAVDERGRPLLYVAVLEGRTAIVERLIALGAPLDPPRFPPLLAAALRDRGREARLLVAAGAHGELARDADGDDALVVAAFREAASVVRALLSVPQSLESKSHALLEAAGAGNLPLVRLLVEHGADPSWTSSRGNSALSVAKKKRRTEVVAFFRSLSRRGD